MIGDGLSLQERILNVRDRSYDERFCTIRKEGVENDHTFGRFIDDSLRYSSFLADRGLEKGDIVLIMKEHSVDLFLSYIGSLLLGAIPAVIPHPTTRVDPVMFGLNLESLIHLTDARIILTGDDLKESLFLGKDALDRTTIEGLDSINIEDHTPLPLNEVPIDSVFEVATIQHSSGTTGLRKGVRLRHSDINLFLRDYSEVISLGEDDRFISWLPLYHDWGLIKFLFLPLLNSNYVYLMSPFEWVLDPALLFEMVYRYRGTIIGLSNFALNVCAHKVTDERMEGMDLSSLRYVMLSSEVIRSHSMDLFLDRFEEWGVKEELMTCAYGMAENTLLATHTPPGKLIRRIKVDRSLLENNGIAGSIGDDSGRIIDELVSCGKPFGTNKIRIVDPEGNDLKPMTVGSIQVRSDHLFTGYHARPDLNSSIMTPDGWYMTKDRGFVDENDELFVLGREDDMIIIGGTNIYPEDVEESIDRVEGARKGRSVVIGIYNNKTGTENLCAIVEPASGEDETIKGLKRRVKVGVQKDLDIVMDRIFIVPRGWLVKSTSGKMARGVNRKRLVDMMERGDI